MSTFPSVLTTYTDPLATNKLNAPSHSGVEQAQNSGLKQVEAVIGVEGSSSVVGTLEYFIKSPASDGGGHIQAANRGGTGQTSFTKGDLLIASSGSVLSKLAVGADGFALVGDSTQGSGVSYKGVATATNIQNQTYVYGVASVLSASVYGVNFGQAVSVLSAGQSFAIKFPTANATSVVALQVSSMLALRVKNPDLTNPAVGDIQPSMIGIVENDGTNFQLVSRNAVNPITVDSLAGVPVSDTSTTVKNTDTAYTTTFTPKVITLYYWIQGTNNVTPETSSGIATFDGTTMQSNLEFIDKGTATATITQGTLVFGTNALSVGANAGGSSIIVTLSIINLSSTGFTVRIAYTVAAGSTGTAKFIVFATK